MKNLNVCIYQFILMINMTLLAPFANATSQEEKDFYDPYIKGLNAALNKQHDWFSHESLPASINIRNTNVPNRAVKPCTKNGTLHNQFVDNLDEMCRLKAFSYWTDVGVPRMREIANTRQNYKKIQYNSNLSYQHFPEFGTSFRRKLILPSKEINPDSIDFRCIWALDTMMPHQQNPFLDTGRALSWFDSPQNTGKGYYIEQCRDTVLDFASHIERTSLQAKAEIEATILIPDNDYLATEIKHVETMTKLWKPTLDLIALERGKKLSDQDLEEVFSYVINEKLHAELENGYCTDKDKKAVYCPGLVEYTNFTIKHLSPPVEKISLKGLHLGMTLKEFYNALQCTDKEQDLPHVPFALAFQHANMQGYEASNIKALGDLLWSCRYYNMKIAGNLLELPVAFFNDDGQLNFLAFSLISPTTSDPASGFNNFIGALNKKYPNAVADNNGFPFTTGDMEARVQDTEGGHLTVFNTHYPIVTLVSEEFVKSQPEKVKKLLEARIANFNDVRDDL